MLGSYDYGYSPKMTGGVNDLLLNFRFAFFGGASGGGGGGGGSSAGSVSASAQATAAQADQRSTTGQGETSGTAGNETSKEGHMNSTTDPGLIVGDGDGSSLYETPNGEPARTPQEWAEHYKGKSWNEITTENKGKHGDGYQRYLGGLIKFRLGPDPNWRYVKLDNGMILDMRHVLVVGMKTHAGFKTGEKLGIYGELAQLLTDRKSAMAKQDYLSNLVGESFLVYLQQNSSYYNPRYSTRDFGNAHETNISWHFYKFISKILFRRK